MLKNNFLIFFSIILLVGSMNFILAALDTESSANICIKDSSNPAKLIYCKLVAKTTSAMGAQTSGIISLFKNYVNLDAKPSYMVFNYVITNTDTAKQFFVPLKTSSEFNNFITRSSGIGVTVKSSCQSSGGTYDSSCNCCKIPAASPWNTAYPAICPSSGWMNKNSWTSTWLVDCGAHPGQPGYVCTTGSHNWANKATETCNVCSAFVYERGCSFLFRCGDNQCQSGDGETATTCFNDCHCGNGICDGGENENTCSDCPVPEPPPVDPGYG